MIQSKRQRIAVGCARWPRRRACRCTTRGTRKYRVVVGHVTALSAESLPAYVTWDEWAIVSDMVTALQAAVSGDAAYTTAQTAW